jgi:DNA-binding Lrp family transcriptional regulator
MDINPTDLALMRSIEKGLPLVKRPYAEVGARLGMSEAEVIQRIAKLQQQQLIKRFGVVVRHRELGYKANAMVVWDIPDDQVSRYGHCLGKFSHVTLCYQRPRILPQWPYNLFTMIHGRDKEEVLANVEAIANECGLGAVPREVLFSGRRFKQRGARYALAHPQDLTPQRKTA